MFCMNANDRIRLRHTLDSAQKARAFSQGKSRADLDKDELLTLALIRLLEIIGEAAAGISAESQIQQPQILWRNIVSMRNRLIHAYFAINLDIVWQAIERDLPLLINDYTPCATLRQLSYKPTNRMLITQINHR